jgi:hypothetical protein
MATSDKPDMGKGTNANANENAGQGSDTVNALSDVAEKLEAHAAEGENDGGQTTEAQQGRRHGLRDALALVEEKIQQLGGRQGRDRRDESGKS